MITRDKHQNLLVCIWLALWAAAQRAPERHTAAAIVIAFNKLFWTQSPSAVWAHKHTKLWMEEKQHYTMMLCLAYALQRSVKNFCRPAFYIPAHRTGTLHAVGAQGTQTHKTMDGKK